MSQRLSFVKIRNQLFVLFLLGVSMAIGTVLLLNSQQRDLIDKNSNLSSLINIAGRQRMISQKLTKDALVVMLDSTQVQERDEEIDSLLTLFQKSHEFLIEQSGHLQSERGSLDSLFEVADPYYQGLIGVCRLIVNGAAISEQMQSLLYYESSFLPVMNSITKEFEIESDLALFLIKENVSNSNYTIALIIILTASIVLLVTIRSIGKYSKNLDEVSGKLSDTLVREQHKVDRLEFLIETINVGIWEYSAIDKTEGWSNQLYEILGYKRGEIAGTADNFLNLVHPNDKGLLMEASESSINTCTPSPTLELRVKAKSGAYKWVEATGNARKDSNNKVELLIGAVIDVTDRKTLEMQLNAFIKRAPAAIAMVNTKMEYILASQRWIEDYGLGGKRVIGKSHYDIFPEIGERWKAVHQNCLKGNVEYHEEDPFERADGTTQYIKWEVRPWYLSPDEIGGILMFTEDVTQSKEEKKQLKSAKEEAEKASRAKEDFLATMSHEIRTPLNAINGISHILLMEGPRLNQIDQIKLLRFSSENLSNLINDILDISKIESGKFALNLAPFDFHKLVRNIRKSMTYRAQENLVELTAEYDEELSRGFEGDAARITQVLYNLVGNAIKFTRNGKVDINVKKIASTGTADNMRVSVKDTGIGIAKENQAKIFRSFEQAESGTTRNFGGTGLGLYITKRLLELMGSQISVSSEVGKGSDFYFDIELNKEGGFEVSGLEHQILKVDLSELSIHILIVEDNTANQTILKKLLKHVGVSYHLAANGQIALDKIVSKKYDMVLMDLEMPVMDGYTATKKIRSLGDEYFEKIPIIALTADAFHSVRDETVAIGMNDYLSKPFKPANLYEIIIKNNGQVKKAHVGYDIEEIINREADGDMAFKKEFSEQCLDNYREFFQNFKEAMKEKDFVSFKRVAHKIHALNTLFELNDFQNELDNLLLKESLFHSSKHLVGRVIHHSESIVEELNKINSK